MDIQPDSLFGVYKVIKRDEDYRGERWHCVCTTCGTGHIRTPYELQVRANTYCSSTACHRPGFGHLKEKYPKEYGLWSAMRAKCGRATHPDYAEFGGNGISVCDQWVNNFHTFIHDMGACGKDRTLARYDETKDFTPDNTYWIKKRKKFTARSRMITHDGKTLPLCKWSDITGLSVSVITYRIDKKNWSPAEALTTPARTRATPIRLTFNGKTQGTAAWAKELGVAQATISARLKQGLPIEEVLAPPHDPTRWIEFRGERLRFEDWCKRLNIDDSTLQRRLQRWPLEKALTTPSRHSTSPVVKYKGKLASINDHARSHGISHQAVAGRLKRGWSLEKALTTPVKRRRPVGSVPPVEKKPLPDFTGVSYHRLTAVRRATEKHGGSRWIWRCDCGNEIEETEGRVRGGQRRTCGCGGSGGVSRPVVDIAGQTFGKLTVLAYEGASWWSCRCECGAYMHRVKKRALLSKDPACPDCKKRKAGSGINGTAATLRKCNAKLYSDMEAALEKREHEFEHIVGPYIFDLVLFDTKTLVEFDGDHHRSAGQAKQDQEKDLCAKTNGWNVVRLQTPTNVDVLDPSLIEGL